MPSPYNSGSHPAPKISYSSPSVTETKYRTGTSDSYYTSVKDVPNRRGGTSTVVIQTKK